MTQGILQGFVPNQGDAWQYTMKSISNFYNEVGKSSAEELRSRIRRMMPRGHRSLHFWNRWDFLRGEQRNCIWLWCRQRLLRNLILLRSLLMTSFSEVSKMRCWS